MLVKAVVPGQHNRIRKEYSQHNMKPSLLFPTMQKLCIFLSLVILISTRWNDDTGNFDIHYGSNNVRGFVVQSFSCNSLQQQQRRSPQLQIKQQSQIQSNAFIPLYHRLHDATTRSKSLVLYAIRDPLVMMPSQTPMVPYKVCTVHVCKRM